VNRFYPIDVNNIVNLNKVHRIERSTRTNSLLFHMSDNEENALVKEFYSKEERYQEWVRLSNLLIAGIE